MSRRICLPPFYYLFVHGLELGRCQGNDLAGVRKPGNKGAAQHVDFAVDRGWSVTNGVEVSIEL